MNIQTLYNKNEIINIDTYLDKYEISNHSEYLNPSGIAIENPFKYKNMEEATTLFKYHYLLQDTCYIIYDSDFDGYSSGTILYQYMKLLNPNWDVKILLHKGKDRGLDDIEIFDKVFNDKPNLLIIPDAGSSSLETTRKIFDNGTNILILDHHIITNQVDCGVLVSNQFNDGVDNNGSGCVVTHIFLRALDKIFNVNYSSRFVDLVSMSILSDSMDIRSLQNRTYLHYGVLYKNNIVNPFLKELFLQFIGDNEEYTQKQISFNIVPKFNSVIRCQELEPKQKLCLALLNECDLKEVIDLCNNSHKSQMNKVEEIINNNKSELDKLSENNLIIFASDDIPRSYSGLVGGKIMGIYQKPTITGTIKEGELIGSLRSPISLQEELNNNQYVEWCRGHENASGICIKEYNLNALNDYYNGLVMSYNPHIQVLSSYSINSIPSHLFGKFDNLEPLWNNNNLPKPIFHIKDIIFEPKEWNIIGKNRRTLKLKIGQYEIIIFNSTKDNKIELQLGYYENGTFVHKPTFNKLKMECVGYLGINEWNNKKTFQIIVDKFEVSYYTNKSKEDLF